MARHAHDGVVEAADLTFGESHHVITWIDSTIQDQATHAIGEGVRVESAEISAVRSADEIEVAVPESSTQQVEIASHIASADLPQPRTVAICARVSERLGQPHRAANLCPGIRR
ncbi:MAG: hypothetical protein WEA35_07465 [Candidatus Nanopelagicales bacterium]